MKKKLFKQFNCIIKNDDKFSLLKELIKFWCSVVQFFLKTIRYLFYQYITKKLV